MASSLRLWALCCFLLAALLLPTATAFELKFALPTLPKFIKNLLHAGYFPFVPEPETPVDPSSQRPVVHDALIEKIQMVLLGVLPDPVFAPPLPERLLYTPPAAVAATKEAFEQRKLALTPGRPGRASARKAAAVAHASARTAALATLPASFDARAAWPECASLQQIRDQGHCGSCWAFGAVEAMSDRHCILGADGVTLSANALLSCCADCGNGCQGGYPAAAWAHWAEHGLVTATCDPYFDTEPCHHPGCGPIKPTPPCRRGCADAEGYKEATHFGASVYAIPSDEATIMHEIMTSGPVEAAYSVFQDFAAYTGGIYRHVAGGFMGGHAVKALGWGVENGTKYWLVANSWSRNWGEDGYFRILRGVDECGFESSMVAGLPRNRPGPDPPWTPTGPDDLASNGPVVDMGPADAGYNNPDDYYRYDDDEAAGMPVVDAQPLGVVHDVPLPRAPGALGGLGEPGGGAAVRRSAGEEADE